MHSSSRGKSGSTPPVDKSVPSWVELKPEEVTDLIVQFANEGKTPTEIGALLRDMHGVPNIKSLTGKKLEEILTENKIASDIPRDLLNLIKKSVVLFKHMNKNKKDFSAKRGYILTVSKIRRLSKYYKIIGKLPEDWKYTQEYAALLVK